MSKRVTDYDTYNYDYSQYWKNREYENNAEHIVLKSFLKNQQGNWFIDIGGSYGRLTDTYANKFKNCVIIDYSLKTLKRNYPTVKSLSPNITLIAANAYKIPFRDNTFDGGLMVRVLHHIKRQKEYFSELSRVLKDDSIYIQEFANKIHLKARIRAILKMDRTLFNREPYQQPTINLEGAKHSGVSFLNYHPQYIINIIEKCGFDIEERQGCSYLRIPILKKILGTKIITGMEKILQKLFSNSNLPPSIFLKTELEKERKDSKEYNSLEEILLCPNCKGEMSFGENIAICNNCHKEYIKDGNIWDFRVD
ncbi:TPA: hypothetical protein DEP90_01000 [Patescibacteria group bacterium]|nr:hypothetical protein [Patescibacteria group bacterium]